MGRYNRSRERSLDRAGIGVRVSDSRQATSRPRAALFVLGMHRSGTSAIAGTLAIVGAKAPRTLMAANSGNARGYWESVRLVELNDEILDPQQRFVGRSEMGGTGTGHLRSDL